MNMKPFRLHCMSEVTTPHKRGANTVKATRSDAPLPEDTLVIAVRCRFSVSILNARAAMTSPSDSENPPPVAAANFTSAAIAREWPCMRTRALASSEPQTPMAEYEPLPGMPSPPAAECE